MHSTAPTTPAPEHPDVIVDCLDGIRTMSDLHLRMQEYLAEGYDVYLGTNPTTGNACLYRKAVAS